VAHRKLRATRLSKKQATQLRLRLDELSTHVQPGQDPIDFVHRYKDSDDQEVAALLASSLAFGRVAAFSQVLDALFDLADRAGGPSAWARRSLHQPDPAIDHLFYRWVRGPDLQRWLRTIARFKQHHGSVQQFVEARYVEKESDIGRVLHQLIAAFRACALDHVDEHFTDLPRGFRHLLPLPGGGSASKRWCMFARWMTRSGSPDLGIWRIPPSKLIIPLDTHIHRVSRFIGLTRRKDASWRTAVEITDNLRRIDIVDPIRYDFVLAHLGISGTCEARRIPATCDPCPLVTVCNIGGPG